MDRQRDAELYTKLKERKVALEDRLLDKLEELKAVCISEAVSNGLTQLCFSVVLFVWNKISSSMPFAF